MQVWVTRAGSVAAYEAWKGVAFGISPPPVTVTSLTSSVPLPAPVGTPITWTATAAGGVGPLEYQFWRLDASGWQIVQPYGTSSTYTWTPLPGDAGVRALQVWVRSAGSTAAYSGWRGTGHFTIAP